MAQKPNKQNRNGNGDERGNDGGGGGGRSGAPAAPPELVVVTHVETALRASAGRFEAMSGAPTNDLATILADHGAAMRPLFGPTEERVAAFSSLSNSMVADASGEPVDMTSFYTIDAAPENLESLRSDLQSHDLVDGAYIKPGAEPPAFLNDMAPVADEAPPASPDFGSRQGYLEAAPGGVEARWAWTQAGGRGNTIRIIDVEGAWRFTHEDLTVNQGGVVGGTMSTDIHWRNHGTAVLGEFSGDLNAIGVTGIASNAVVSAISIFGPGSAGAINAAAARLGAGDVILIELHRPGPRFNFANRDDQRGYIAVEWWPDDFVAIRNAVNRGIIVVEAGGNGAENLDDAVYQTAASGFPAGWTNPFRRANRDSGAIVVGAGAPPPGTHGRNNGADRSRLDFSNFGALFDTQGWGREVTTTGYGDLQGGTNEDLWYTDTFSGTSSASPIIVGVAASLQGMARARGHAVLTPAQFRSCLRSTGSPQQDEPGRPATQRIGTRPNLRQLAICAFGKAAVKEIKEGKDIAKDGKEIVKELKDARKETKEIKELRKDAAKEVKEIRKEQIKEVKEIRKEQIKELKERPDKQLKEKDKDKDAFEGGGVIRDQVIQRGSLGEEAPATSVEGRLAAIENAIDSLVHFIGADLRPDLSASALGAQATQEDEQSKQWKDQKDNEGY